MFNSLKNFASSAANAASSVAARATSAVVSIATSSPSHSREPSQVEVVEDDSATAVIEEPTLESIVEEAAVVVPAPRDFLEEPTVDERPDEEYDAIPDSTYFQRNYLLNVAALPHTDFSLSDANICVEQLQFMCRRKKLKASSRIHAGSVKIHGKVTHFSRRVYVPPREVIEITVCDGTHVWRGNADFNIHNVTRFHKGDTWNIHQFNDIIEDALCFPDEHPGLHYTLKSTLAGSALSGGASEEGGEQPAAGDGVGKSRADDKGVEQKVGNDDADVDTSRVQSAVSAVPAVSNLLLEVHGGKELDDLSKFYINNGCLLHLLVPPIPPVSPVFPESNECHESPQDHSGTVDKEGKEVKENKEDKEGEEGKEDADGVEGAGGARDKPDREENNYITPAQFQSFMRDLVLRRFCSLARAGNLRFAKRIHRRFQSLLDVNGQEEGSGWSPVHFATHKGSLPFLAWLVDDLGVPPTALARWGGG